MHFENDWIKLSTECQLMIWSFSEETEKRIIEEHSSWTMQGLIEKRLAKVRSLKDKLGRNAYVALSGGIDSQATCLLLMQAKIPFTPVILKFNDALNQHDISSAYSFCSKYKLVPLVIELDILKFLNTQLLHYVHKYQCPSPQITAHLWLFETLIQKHRATSILAGGNPPYIQKENSWGFMSTRSQSAWMTFADVNEFPLFGNFLGYSFDIALPLMLTSYPKEIMSGYAMKTRGMLETGLRVVPQETKFNGFERVKEYLENRTGDGLAFEKAYRQRYTKLVPEYQSILVVDTKISSILFDAQR